MSGALTNGRSRLTRQDLASVAPEDTLGEVAEKLAAESSQRALVLDCGRVIGTVGIPEFLHAAAQRVHPSEGRVREWMAPMNTNEGRRAFTSEPPVDLVFCGLTWAAGGLEPCPGEACTFWSNDHCVLAWLREDELAGAPEFTSLLLGVRRQFERSGSAPSRPAS